MKNITIIGLLSICSACTQQPEKIEKVSDDNNAVLIVSRDFLINAAQHGSVPAQFELANAYENGGIVSKNPKLAFQWYEKLAKSGYKIAQNRIGAYYSKGFGTAKNEHEAYNWYLKAAQQGYSIAQINLGMYYLNGRHVKKSPSKALYWLKKAAIQDDAFAKRKLGYLYYKGDLINADWKKARFWFSQAAELNDVQSRYYLCDMLASANDVKKSDSEKFNWFKSTSESQIKNAESHYCLGQIYEYGWYKQPQDKLEAMRWFQMSALYGYADAEMEVYKILQEKM